MRFSYNAALVAVTLMGSAATADDCPALPIEGPFALTIVIKDSTETYATNIEYASRGVPDLNPTTTSNQTFTWNVDESRVIMGGKSFYKSGKISKGSVFFFWSEGSMPDDGEWLLEQTVSDCAVYLVKEGSTKEEGVFQWQSTPPQSSLSPISWLGSVAEANAAIRVDVTKSS
ncbi:unnamed protein product [Clonostachys rhizophaga]|uniref:Uncharacterized protein n=1 Tax=Clonostachys rhizophaga TaxID=160324 RepID=A0A9N9VCZ9_9HYPO|nr:unnamed protein product [Clonostachys rhizophaga]